jgi:hypothetical protein
MTDGDPTAAPRSRTASAILLPLGIVMVVLLACLALLAGNLYSGLYIYTPVQYGWNCSASLQCVVTLRSEGGGFDHGFNPVVHWSISGQPEGSVFVSPGTGSLQAGQSTTILLRVVAGSCPNTISVTSKNSIFNFSPFATDPQTKGCVLNPDSSSSSLMFRPGPVSGPVGVEPARRTGRELGWKMTLCLSSVDSV